MSDHLADAVRDDLREAGAVLRPLVYLGATRRAAAHVLMDPDRAGEMGRGLTRAGLGSNPAVTLEIAHEQLDSHAPVFACALRTVLRAQTNAPEAVAAAGSLQPPPRLVPLHAAVVAGLAATTRVWDLEMDGFRAPTEGRPPHDPAADRLVIHDAERTWAEIEATIERFGQPLTDAVYDALPRSVLGAIFSRFLKVPNELEFAEAQLSSSPFWDESAWQPLDRRELADTLWRVNQPTSRPAPGPPTLADQALPTLDRLLLMMGDRRLPDLLDGWRRDQSGTAKIAAWQFVPDAIFAGAVECVLRWLEDPDEMELGAPAGFLHGLPRLPGTGREVLEVEWDLPADNTLGPDGHSRRRGSYRVLRRWTVEEFGRLIEPRLRAVSAREGDPEPFRLVMQAWGIDP